MRTTPWKGLLPVFAALAVFYTLSLVYFSPMLEGKQLVQGDLRNWQGMAQEVLEHRTAFDEDPLWTGSMFSGMPAYQITVLWPKNLLLHAHKAFGGFLPRPASFLFLYLLGMYVLMRCLRIDPWLSITGAVAFGFSSYFFVILEAGHNSKANAIGYMPMVLGAAYLLFRGGALLGAVLLALFLGLEIAMNHVQITYYLGFVLALFALAEAVRAVREKAVGNFVRRSALGLGGVVLALACNIGLLWTTWEYGKHTTRGKSELTIKADGTPANDIRTSGLDRDYVTQWSYGKQESFTLLVPNTKGGASGSIITRQEDLLAFTDPMFRNALVKEYQGGGYVNAYWGDQAFTSGPVYLGALTVLLMLLSLARAEGSARWWVLGAIPLIGALIATTSPIVAGILLIAYLAAGLLLWKDTLAYALFSALLIALLLSWGRHLMPLTDFFLDHVPGYSKFRAVTIILVVVELAAPVLGMLYLDRMLREKAMDGMKDPRFLVPAGALLALLLAFAVAPGVFFDFVSDTERERFNARIDGGMATEGEVVAFVEGIKGHRMGVFRADVWRSFAYVVAGAVLLFLFGRRTIGRSVLVPAIGLLVLTDLWAVDKRYVNNEKDRGRYLGWDDAKNIDLPFKPSAADMAILQQEWTPAAEADHTGTIERMKQQRRGASGLGRLVGADEETLVRFAALRRNSDFRVLTLANPFNDSRTSYFHKSVGGYHGAKLQRYQELIEFHLAPATQRVAALLQGGTSVMGMDSLMAREGVLNMLNTRYLVYNPERPPIANTNALGSAWFVDELRWVKDADEEITALGAIDPSRTALVDERFRPAIGDAKATFDPAASVTLDRYRANEMAYTVRSNKGGVVVFSAIWYGPDWKATINGQPAAHARANYVLRAMAVPPGEHQVVFRVESRPYNVSGAVGLASSALLLLLALALLGTELRRHLRQETTG